MSESKKRYGDYSEDVFIKDIYDVDLPVFLKRDIDALLEGIKTNSSLLDCLQDEYMARSIVHIGTIRSLKNTLII